MKNIILFKLSNSVYCLGLMALTLSFSAQSYAQSQRRPSSNSAENTNVQVDTSGRSVTQERRSTIKGNGVGADVNVQLNYSGCEGQKSNQNNQVDRGNTTGASASSQVSVCDPTTKYR